MAALAVLWWVEPEPELGASAVVDKPSEGREACDVSVIASGREVWDLGWLVWVEGRLCF